MKHIAPAAYGERNGRIADGRIADVKPLRIPPHHFVLPRKPVRARANVVRIAELPVDPRSAEIELQASRNDHRRALDLETVIEETCKVLGVWAFEVVEPAPVVLAFQCKAAIFQAAIYVKHPVA